MNPLDFDYVQARSIEDAVNQYIELTRAGNETLYYGGGTEILTLGRVGAIYADQVIDVKTVPETREIRLDGDRLYLGSALTLTELTGDSLIQQEFPLLRALAREIADRTARNKITLGGNLCGSIFYREIVLAALVCESQLRIAGPSGLRDVPIRHVFQRSMNLSPGEFIVHMAADGVARKSPFVHIKRRKMGSVGYPIVTAAAIRVDGRIRAAFSGLFPFPIRSLAMEEELNRDDVPEERRVENILHRIDEQWVLDDYEASRAFRLVVFRQVLRDILRQLGE